MTNTASLAEIETLRELIESSKRVRAHRDELLRANENQRLFIKALQERNATLEAETQPKTSTVLQNAVGELERQVDNLKSDLATRDEDLIKERDTLKADLKEMGRAFTFVRRERDQLQVQRDNMERAYLDAEKQVTDLRAQLTNTKHELTRKTETIDGLARMIASARS